MKLPSIALFGLLLAVPAAAAPTLRAGDVSDGGGGDPPGPAAELGFVPEEILEEEGHDQRRGERDLQNEKKKRKGKKRKRNGGGGGGSGGGRLCLLFFGKTTQFCMEAQSLRKGAEVRTAKCGSTSRQKISRSGDQFKFTGSAGLCLKQEGMWINVGDCGSSGTSFAWSNGQIRSGSRVATQRHKPGKNERIKMQDRGRAARHGTDRWKKG